MRASCEWLKTLVDTDQSAEQIAHAITMAGLEVDSIEPAAGEFSKVVVAEIKKRERHPDADRLQVLSVDAGESEPLQIVTAATNVYEGMKVPLALVGASLCNGLKIKKSKLRGVVSQGMLCGASECGLSEEKDTGIMELAQDAPIGTDLHDYLSLNDTILDIDLTPNRSDCLAMIGIARDLSALTDIPVNMPEVQTPLVTTSNQPSAEVKAADLCPRYLLQGVEEINANVSTPLWIAERLRRAGIGPVNAIVDVANYVMIELGQPLHVFDADKLDGNLTVRLAKDCEELFGLDEKTYKLNNTDLVIADNSGAVAVAGIMGNMATGVSKDTRNIIVESAFFDPATIMQSSRDLTIKTQSAYRFERGVDFEGQARGLARAVDLITQIAGGRVGPINAIEDQSALPVVEPIKLRRARIEKILGISIDDAQVEQLLTRLGLALTAQEDGWMIGVPSFRFDIRQEIDLIEELARLYGYNNIPSQSARGPLFISEPDSANTRVKATPRFFEQHGFLECINYAFISEEQYALVSDKAADESLVLLNPISSEQSIMRPSLWPGLLATAKENGRFGHYDLMLFETGLVFDAHKGKREQTARVAALMSGEVRGQQWNQTPHQADFFDIKSLAEQLFIAWSLDFDVRVSKLKCFHPSVQAEIRCGGKVVGHIGQLHPRMQKALDIKHPVFLLSCDLYCSLDVQAHLYKQIPVYPQVQRDLAFVVPNDVQYGDFLAELKELAGEALVDTHLFDQFSGKDIPEGHKSWAISLIFMDLNRTLVDDEINAMIDNVVKGLAARFNAHIRM